MTKMMTVVATALLVVGCMAPLKPTKEIKPIEAGAL